MREQCNAVTCLLSVSLCLSLSLSLCLSSLSRALSLFKNIFLSLIANVQVKRAESARLLVELQQAQEKINALTQVLSRCFTVVRALSRNFCD